MRAGVMNIGTLESKLNRFFPKKTAMDWDKNGLLVGDKNQILTKIAVALDPTIDAVEKAASVGANLLLTHHPAYLEGVQDFLPANSVFKADGALVYTAIKNNVALMNFHTPLDQCDAGRKIIPEKLALSPEFILCPGDGLDHLHTRYGFGMINSTVENNLTLRDLALRAEFVFGRKPRTWGDLNKKLEMVGTTTGSTGSHAVVNNLLHYCTIVEADCLVCGEIKYHDALNLAQSGVSVIELGHDVSELPLVEVLYNTLVDIDIDQNDLVMIDQSKNWE